MGTDRRLFLAAPLTDEARHSLAAFLGADGRPAIPGRRVPPENWHITLRFLGRSSQIQQEKVLAALDGGLGAGAFHVGFGGLGMFPRPSKATVVWLGVTRGDEELEALAADCERAALAAGFDPEERPFHPHLTLSRVRPPQNLIELAAAYPDFPGRLRVNAVVLYESITGPGGARYAVVERIAL